MAIRRLSDVAVRALKPGPKVRKVSDGEGLQLHVQPGGSKLWRYAYRLGGKQMGLALGAYPLLSLAEARELHGRLRKALYMGQDPARVLRQEKKAQVEVRARVQTFEDVAKRWFKSRRNGWVDGYAERVWARVDDDLNSQFGKVPMVDVDSTDILTALRKIEGRGAFEMAKRVKQYAHDIFRFARAERIVRENPVEELHRALAKSPPKKRRAALKAVQMPELMTKLAAYDGEVITRLALRLTLLTFVRTSETRFAEWTEFEALEEVDPLWRISADRMKMRHEHLVPLSRQAVAVLGELKALRLPGPYLFPATRRLVISQNTMICALYRMGFLGRATVHGFRGTASTVLNEHDFNRDWVERQLAHSEQDEVRASYNSAQWLPQRRHMMQWWADWLDDQEAKGAGDWPRLVAG